MPELRATILVDNTSADGLKGEWGLSALIEYRGKKILLDTGASELFSKNAKELGFSLSEVDYAVLSHAHYDHGNGMERFFSENPSAPFFVQECCGEDCYKKILFFPKYIGLPKGILEKYPDRVTRVKEDCEPSEGVHLIAHKRPGRAEIGKRESMYRKLKSGWVLDDFSHEQSLVFETEKGLVIFNSCSHGGAADIVGEVRDTMKERALEMQRNTAGDAQTEALADADQDAALTSADRVAAMIGGFHLFTKTDVEVRDFAAKLKECDVPYVCTGHCTGDHAYQILSDALGERLHHLRVGLVIEI